MTPMLVFGPRRSMKFYQAYAKNINCCCLGMSLKCKNIIIEYLNLIFLSPSLTPKTVVKIKAFVP